MRRLSGAPARVTVAGFALLTLVTATVVSVASRTSASAQATSGAYELYCPGSSIGTVVLNDVITSATLSPVAPALGVSFTLTDYQTILNLPQSIAAAAASVQPNLTGSFTAQIDASGATPSTTSVGPIDFNVTLPSPVPAEGVTLSFPSTAVTVGPFVATSANITIQEDSAASLTLTEPAGNLSLTCMAYPNDSVTPSGITTSAPTVRPIAPVIAIAGGGNGSITVTGISPNSGPTAGGTPVTITGTGFATTPGATLFDFGSNPATGVSCSSSTTCVATTPSGAAGTPVEVTATVNGQTSILNPPGDQFTYTGTPSVLTQAENFLAFFQSPPDLPTGVSDPYSKTAKVLGAYLQPLETRVQSGNPLTQSQLTSLENVVTVLQVVLKNVPTVHTTPADLAQRNGFGVPDSGEWGAALRTSSDLADNIIGIATNIINMAFDLATAPKPVKKPILKVLTKVLTKDVPRYIHSLLNDLATALNKGKLTPALKRKLAQIIKQVAIEAFKHLVVAGASTQHDEIRDLALAWNGTNIDPDIAGLIPKAAARATPISAVLLDPLEASLEQPTSIMDLNASQLGFEYTNPLLQGIETLLGLIPQIGPALDVGFNLGEALSRIGETGAQFDYVLGAGPVVLPNVIDGLQVLPALIPNWNNQEVTLLTF